MLINLLDHGSQKSGESCSRKSERACPSPSDSAQSNTFEKRRKSKGKYRLGCEKSLERETETKKRVQNFPTEIHHGGVDFSFLKQRRSLGQLDFSEIRDSILARRLRPKGRFMNHTLSEDLKGGWAR